jgi:hypothetical protein
MSLLDLDGAIAGCGGDASVDPVAFAVLVSGSEISDVP